MEDRELLRKRFLELIRKSDNYYTFTPFLGLMEQSVLKAVLRETRAKYSLFGEGSGIERTMARFGDEEELGYDAPFPVSIIKILPKSEKFSENLSHRDYLGSLMNLGIEREVLGDIIIRDKCAYLFCKEDIAEYILSSLERIRHTDITLSLTDSIPDGELVRKKRIKIQANGERIDAVVAKVFGLSREDSSLLHKRGLVFINGEECESVSKILKANDLVSVRGHGRFLYLGYESLSKKGKLNIEIELYC